MVKKKNTSFNLEVELLKQIKLQAIREEITQTELITRYLKAGLKMDGVEI